MKKILFACFLMIFLAGNGFAAEKLTPQQKIQSLRVQIEQHNKNYYEFDVPTIVLPPYNWSKDWGLDRN